MSDPDLKPLLQRIADALEGLQPTDPAPPDLASADAFVWQAQGCRLQPVPSVAHVDLALLVGIDGVRDTLLDNTRRFARGHSANNALLWGARGMGKSSLVKAAHAAINQETPGTLVLVEIHREDVPTLPQLLAILAAAPRRCILFCDDLSFDTADTSYKSLKAVLEGGLEGRPENVLFYATSNRRHLMPRDMIENERSTAINPSESVEETVSLSDRFGLWLGFHSCNQAEYLSMIEAYVQQLGLEIAAEQLHADAIKWSMTRGARSGRVAWQFIQDLAGRQEKQV
jgi:predicted AAA+ superfamily ATPase